MYRVRWNRVRLAVALTVAAGAVCAAAMAAAATQGGAVDKPKSETSEPLNLSGQMGGMPRGNVIARSAVEFERLWQAHTSHVLQRPAAPNVDFKKYDVVAVFAGSRPTGGYRVVIVDVTRSGKKAVVHATIHKPGPGTIVTQAFTAPYAMRAVEKLPPSVTFDVTEQGPGAK